MKIAARVLTGLLVFQGVGCVEDPFPLPEELSLIRNLHSPVAQPPDDPTNRFAKNALAISVGTRLFRDQGLSACGTVSCESCHSGEGLTYPEPTAVGCDGQRTARNAPSLINVAYHSIFMWDGRADRLWSQAILPLLNPVEMASTPAIVRARLESAYLAEYMELFSKPPSETPDSEMLANVGKLIAAYEGTLNHLRAPFDDDIKRFIDAAERGEAARDPLYVGLKAFVRDGQCSACHKGPLLTDNEFHNIGIEDGSEGARGASDGLPFLFASEFNSAGIHSDDPTGEVANRLGNLQSKLVNEPKTFLGGFRTPSLRDVERTAPYMHTGALATLEDVITLYDEGGVPHGKHLGDKADTITPLGLSKEQKQALLELLRSMSSRR